MSRVAGVLLERCTPNTSEVVMFHYIGTLLGMSVWIANGLPVFLGIVSATDSMSPPPDCLQCVDELSSSNNYPSGIRHHLHAIRVRGAI